MQTSVSSVQVVPCAPGKKAAEDVNRFAAPVKSSKQLLEESAAGDRATTLVTLDLGSLPYLQYSPGDYLVMYPETSPKVRVLCRTCARREGADEAHERRL